jgi:hypothetical protein
LIKLCHPAWHQWLKPVILATQEAEIRKIVVRSQPGQIVLQDLLKNPFTKIRLVEWLKVKALSSNPSTLPPQKYICHSSDNGHLSVSLL